MHNNAYHVCFVAGSLRKTAIAQFARFDHLLQVHRFHVHLQVRFAPISHGTMGTDVLALLRVRYYMDRKVVHQLTAHRAQLPAGVLMVLRTPEGLS